MRAVSCVLPKLPNAIDIRHMNSHLMNAQLRVSENKALSRVTGSEDEQVVTGGRRKLREEDIRNLYSSHTLS